ncbi:MAG TPA: ABC transporter permease [Jatrophihabitantaceae bacterium]|nr:ABC transporter permease [Jatrophihabitantaceae bacterium]
MNFTSVSIALRGIYANKLRSALTTLGILIGVASVIILVAVGSGTAEKSRQQLEALGSNTLTVSAGGFGAGARGGTQSRQVLITDADVTALADPGNAPDVTAVVPAVNAANVTVVFDGASESTAQVQGTTPNFVTVRNYPVQWGSFFTQSDMDNRSKVVVIGTSVVKNLLGDTADPSTVVGQQIQLNGRSFTIGGVFKSKGSNGFQDQDDIVVLPIPALRDTLTGNTGGVSSLTVQAASASLTAAAQSEVTAVLLAQHPSASSTDYRVLNQASLLQTQQENNRTFTVLLGSVAAISLLVGGIGVMNIMLVTVTERTREIGIRKAVGARRTHILTQFLVEAVLLSGIGGLLGVVAGILGSRFNIVNVQPIVEPYSVFLAFGFAVATGLFFGIYPANRAATLRPIDALRYE